MTGPGSACYNRIRFTMDDADGHLRFRKLDLEGGPVCEGVLERLRKYLQGRPLREVDLAEVRRLTADCHSECGTELLRVIGDQKKLFCSESNSSDRASP